MRNNHRCAGLYCDNYISGKKVLCSDCKAKHDKERRRSYYLVSRTTDKEYNPHTGDSDSTIRRRLRYRTKSCLSCLLPFTGRVILKNRLMPVSVTMNAHLCMECTDYLRLSALYNLLNNTTPLLDHKQYDYLFFDRQWQVTAQGGQRMADVRQGEWGDDALLNQLNSLLSVADRYLAPDEGATVVRQMIKNLLYTPQHDTSYLDLKIITALAVTFAIRTSAIMITADTGLPFALIRADMDGVLDAVVSESDRAIIQSRYTSESVNRFGPNDLYNLFITSPLSGIRGLPPLFEELTAPFLWMFEALIKKNHVEEARADHMRSILGVAYERSFVATGIHVTDMKE